VFDQQYRYRYIFAGLQPGQRIPREGLESGVIVQADTLAELAPKAGSLQTSCPRRSNASTGSCVPVWTRTFTVVRAPTTGLRSRICLCRRLSEANPARFVYLRDDLQGAGGRITGRRCLARGVLRCAVRRCGVPRHDAAVQHREGDRLLAMVTAPSRDKAVGLSGVELAPA
jgi:hypothetical protein